MFYIQAFILIAILLPSLTLQERSFIGPTNEVAIVNTTIEFKCHLIGGSPNDRVAWLFRGLPLAKGDQKDGFGYTRITSKKGFRVYENLRLGDFRLKLSSVSIDDEGSVQCQAPATEISGHLNSPIVNLTVQVPPNDIKMKIHTSNNIFETRSEFNLRSNNTFKVRCEIAPCSPPPIVTWKIGDVPLENQMNSVFIRKQELPAGGKNVMVDSIVTFVAEPWMDGKDLKCLGSHPALDQPLEKSVPMSVLYIPFVNISLIPDLPTHREFSSVLAVCNILAKPQYNSIKWYVGGKQVKNATTDMLQLASITRDFHGLQIQCEAENSIGTSHASVDVHVTYGPKFVSKETPEDIWVDPRERVTLKCDDVLSNPPATVRWLRRSNFNHKDPAVGEGGSSSTPVGDVTSGMSDGDDDDDLEDEDEELEEGGVLSFTPYDSRAFGVYTCIASAPGFDDASRKFYVGMKGRPTVIGHKEQGAVLGRIGSLTCVVRGIPRPDRIIWYKNRELLDFDKEIRYSSKEKDIRHGRVSKVEILDTIESDFTIFNCSASSSHGFDSQLIVLRKRELVPFYCWVATIAASMVLIMIVITSVVCCKYWKKMPGSLVCCQKNKKLPSSDGSASTSQTSSDSMDLKRICNLPDISIHHHHHHQQQHKNNKNNYLPTTFNNKQSPTFDSLEQNQKLLQVGDTVEKSYTRFESPNHHMYNYHPNRPYPCDSPDCQSTLGMRHNVDDFITDRYGTYNSGGARGYPFNGERDSFLNPYHKPCMQEDCSASTAFEAYTKLAPGNLYGPTPVISMANDVEEREEDYADDIRRSQYNPNLCMVPPLTLNRQFYQPPSIHHPPHQHSPSSVGSAYPPRGPPPKQPQSTSSYSSPSPTDSKLSTNV